MAFLFVDISLPYSNNRVMHTMIKALEVLFISVGIVFTLLMLKVAAAPYTCDVAFSGLVVVFRDAIRCFSSSPLYICVAINFMVLLIAVSSTFHRRKNDRLDLNININLGCDFDDAGILESPPRDPPRYISTTAPPPLRSPLTMTTPRRECTKLHSSSHKETLSDGSFRSEVHKLEKLNSPNSSTPDSVDSVMEENKVTTPPSLERGKEMYVEEKCRDTDNQTNDQENEEEDTIEATWNAITGGGTRKPRKKQLKKSDTWDVPPRKSTMHRLDSEEILPTTPRWKELRKSETFNDAVSLTRRGGLVRRDPSMTLEEFNQQVEAFIKKFNDEMRLQRQESDRRFFDMINNRGL